MTTERVDGPNLRANGESRADSFLSPRVLTREAAKIADELRLPVRGAQLRKLITRFVDEGHTMSELRGYLLTYADPTGERAARNVDRTAT